MTVAALSAERRGVLEKLVQRGRQVLEEDLETTLEGRFGIHIDDGRVEPVEALTLTASGLAVRADLVDVIDYLRSEGAGPDEAARRLVREAAFTHLNRLVAVRVAEAIGLIPETLANGIDSQGFRGFAEIAPASARTEWERYALFVRLCADELASDAPALFDPRNPLLELEPTETALSSLVGAIAEVGDDVWGAPDALGWAYQFFNTGDERRKMREAPAPRNSRELAVRNQFFTPSYVVEFLVHNGLGAHLAAGIPRMADHLPLLVQEPTERVDIDLEAVSVLDPACGSGHFLLGAYDVLERAWQLCGVEPHDAAPHIVRSLWGIDIDPRTTQIAQAAVVFRARRHHRGRLPVPNVICARSLPTGQAVDELVAGLPVHVQRAVRAIADELVDAPILGPLLRIEERLGREVRDVFGTGVIEGTFAEALPREETENAATEVLDALTRVADSATSTAAHRLFAAEARDAVRFVEAMRRRYTAVLMNPPFGEPVPETKPYLKAAYPWIPTRDYNLFAAFVGRGLELSQSGLGSSGAITSRSGMFLRTFEAWRKQVILDSDLLVLADLGYGVMEQALVEAAAYVIRNRRPDGAGTYIRLLRDSDRPSALAQSIKRHRESLSDGRLFHVRSRDLDVVDGAPMSYWMAPSIRRLFLDYPAVEGTAAEVRVGLQSGDNFRFIRLRWEVDQSRIGYSNEDSLAGNYWAPYCKGGEYSPYWSDVGLVINWRESGRPISEAPGSRFQNSQYYFRTGITWPTRTASGMSPRLLPSGCVFDTKGSLAVPIRGTSPFALLGWLGSRLVSAIMSALVAAGDEVTSGGASKNYDVGLVQRLPWLHVEGVDELVGGLAVRRANEDALDERTSRFASIVDDDLRLARILDQLADGHELDQTVNRAAGLDSSARQYLDLELGPYPLTYPETTDHDDRIAELYQRPIDAVIDELIEERGGARAIANLTYVADRRVEVIAHGLQVSPRSIVRVVQDRGLSAPGELEDHAFRLVSYLVGVAFGRWDVRIGRDPSLASVPDDLLSPPARYAPGALLDEDGRPPLRTPPGYPVDMPADGVLVDQPGHTWHIVDRVRQAAGALLDSESQLDEALWVLMKRPSLVTYLRREFFKNHLSMYSMSRRRAPIYWQLQVPSKAWGVWLYAPRLSREMLFAVVREAEERRRLAEQHIARLQRELDQGGGGRSVSATAKELDAEQKLATELDVFRAEAERIANLGWEPDLDDGIILNAAPLADLFPAWKDAATYREHLRKGKYEWSAVARFAEVL